MDVRRALVVALAVMGCQVEAAAGSAPLRVMSLNLCADQLLLALLPSERIVSITWLSRTQGDPQLLPLVQGIATNHGTAEEVLALRPDLVVAGRFTTSTTRHLLRQVGVPLFELDAASDWSGIRRITRDLAAAVGAEVRAEQLIADMDAKLHRLQLQQREPPLRVLGWNGNGADVPGRDTLFTAIVEAAGGVNIAALDTRQRSFDLESILRAKPEVLMRGVANSDAPALRTSMAIHPALRRAVGDRMLTYPEAVYSCGVPRAAQLAEELAVEFMRHGSLQGAQ